MVRGVEEGLDDRQLASVTAPPSNLDVAQCANRVTYVPGLGACSVTINCQLRVLFALPCSNFTCFLAGSSVYQQCRCSQH